MTASARNKGGRPRRREPEPGERVSLGLRVTPDLKNKLDAAAKAAGRSQSQEAELRLENSFRGERYLDEAMELAYGRQPSALLAIIAHVMDDAGKFGGFDAAGTAEGATDWLRIPDAVEQAKQAICEVLSAFQPEGYQPPDFRIELPPGFGPAAGMPSRGVGFARGALEAIKNPDRGGTIGEWARPIREKLGDLASKLSIDDAAIMVSAIAPPHQPSQPMASAALLLTKRKGQSK